MFYKIQRLVFASFLLIFISHDCFGCFTNDEQHRTTIATGSTFYQECQCIEPGYSVHSLRWFDNENKIITMGPGTDSNIFVERMSDRINLHITNITKAMSGTYKCINEYEGRQYVQTYIIDAYDPLYIIDTANTQYLVEGRDVRINCTAKGESTPLIHWHKENERGEYIEINNDEKYEKTQEGLIVKNVNKDDKGSYKCAAVVITTGEEVERFIKTEVMTIPVIQDLIALPEPTVVENKTLSIECLAEGMPSPEYVWKKISNEASDEGVSQIWQQSTILFDYIKPEDEGIYECTAFNFAGNVSKEINIQVLIPPTITYFDNITATEGEIVPIDCKATGRPQPNVTITMKKLDQDNTVERENIVYIPNATLIKTEYLKHHGVYTCKAVNEVGSIEKNMYVTISHQPYFYDNNETMWGWNEKIVNLSCVHDSNPPAVVRWSITVNSSTNIVPEELIKQFIKTLTNVPEKYLTVTIDKNFAYGVYECLVENIYGQARKTMTIKQGFPPHIVTNINFIEITATSVLFSIDGPYDINGPEIIGYTAEYDEAGNYNITNIHINRTWAVGRPYRLNKLRPNTTYYVRFAAMNEVGAGPWSEMLDFVTLEKSIPEPPMWDIDETQLSSSDWVLKWKEPEDNGEVIDYYVLRYCSKQDSHDESLCEEKIIDAKTELMFDKLKSNTTYYLELIAHNAEGNSSASNITLEIPATVLEASTMLPAGAIIGIAIVIVIICLILVDLLFLFWKQQGIIASCICKKNDKKTSTLQSRDKKGLLRENCESADNTLRSTNRVKEYEYNKTTGIITGKHSAV